MARARLRLSLAEDGFFGFRNAVTPGTGKKDGGKTSVTRKSEGFLKSSKFEKAKPMTKVPQQDADGPAADSFFTTEQIYAVFWGVLSLGVSEDVVLTSNSWQFQWEKK